MKKFLICQLATALGVCIPELAQAKGKWINKAGSTAGYSIEEASVGFNAAGLKSQVGTAWKNVIEKQMPSWNRLTVEYLNSFLGFEFTEEEVTAQIAGLTAYIGETDPSTAMMEIELAISGDRESIYKVLNLEDVAVEDVPEAAATVVETPVKAVTEPVAAEQPATEVAEVAEAVEEAVPVAVATETPEAVKLELELEVTEEAVESAVEEIVHGAQVSTVAANLVSAVTQVAQTNVQESAKLVALSSKLAEIATQQLQMNQSILDGLNAG